MKLSSRTRLGLQVLASIALIALYTLQGDLPALIDGAIAGRALSAGAPGEIAPAARRPFAVIALGKNPALGVVHFRAEMMVPLLEKFAKLREADPAAMSAYRTASARLDSLGAEADAAQARLKDKLCCGQGWETRFAEENKSLAEEASRKREVPERERDAMARRLAASSPSLLVFDICFASVPGHDEALIKTLGRLADPSAGPPLRTLSVGYDPPECDLGPAEAPIYSNFTAIACGAALGDRGGVVRYVPLTCGNARGGKSADTPISDAGKTIGSTAGGSYNLPLEAYRLHAQVSNPGFDPSRLAEKHGDSLPVVFTGSLAPSVADLEKIPPLPRRDDTVLYLRDAAAVKALDGARLAEFAAGRTVFIGGVDPPGTPGADLRLTPRGVTPGLFVHVNAFATLLAGEKARLLYGLPWAPVISVLLVAALFGLHRLFMKIFRPGTPRAGMALPLSLFASLALLAVLWAALWLGYGVLLYDCSVAALSCGVAAFLLRENSRAAMTAMLMGLRGKAGRLFDLIRVAGEKYAALNDGRALFNAADPEFARAVEESLIDIHTEADFKAAIGGFYRWFYDGSGTLDRFPPEFKELGLRIKIIRVFDQHLLPGLAPEEQLREKKESLGEVLSRYTGRDYLLADDVAAYRKIRDAILAEITDFLASLIAHYDRAAAEKGEKAKRRAENPYRRLADPAEAEARLSAAFPETHNAIVEALRGAESKEEALAALRALGLDDREVGSVFKSLSS